MTRRPTYSEARRVLLTLSSVYEPQARPISQQQQPAAGAAVLPAAGLAEPDGTAACPGPRGRDEDVMGGPAATPAGGDQLAGEEAGVDADSQGDKVRWRVRWALLLAN